MKNAVMHSVLMADVTNGLCAELDSKTWIWCCYRVSERIVDRILVEPEILTLGGLVDQSKAGIFIERAGLTCLMVRALLKSIDKPVPFGPNLVGSQWSRIWVEPPPSRFSIGLSACKDIHRTLIKDRFIARALAIGDSRRKDRSTTPHAFGINLRIFF